MKTFFKGFNTGLGATLGVFAGIFILSGIIKKTATNKVNKKLEELREKTDKIVEDLYDKEHDILN